MDLLEQKFQRTNKIITDEIFPTNTPIGFKEEQRPRKLASRLADRFFSSISRRVKPIMKVRDAMDNVYAKGYFEQHYPDADKKLKTILHEEALVAHSRLNEPTPDDDEDEKDKGLLGGLNITISIGGKNHG